MAASPFWPGDYWPEGYWPVYWPLLGEPEILVRPPSLVLRWNGGASIFYFLSLQDGYAGEGAEIIRKADRSLDAGDLYVVQDSESFRAYEGTLRVNAAPTASIEFEGATIYEGSWDDLQDAYDADDLEARTYFDATYWPCVPMGDLMALPEYDPMLNYVAVPLRLAALEA